MLLVLSITMALGFGFFISSSINFNPLSTVLIVSWLTLRYPDIWVFQNVLFPAPGGPKKKITCRYCWLTFSSCRIKVEGLSFKNGLLGKLLGYALWQGRQSFLLS